MPKEKINDEDDFEYEFTPEDIKELDERRQRRLNGESKVYTWEESLAMIKKNNNKDLQ